MQRIKAVAAPCPCLRVAVFEVPSPLPGELSTQFFHSFPIQHSLDAFSELGMGGVARKQNFSTLPELGQAEIVPWKPNKASKPGWAHLATKDAGAGSSPGSQGEFRGLWSVPCASATCQRDGVAALLRWQQLINFPDFCGAPAAGPKRRRKFVIQSETAVKWRSWEGRSLCHRVSSFPSAASEADPADCRQCWAGLCSETRVPAALK